MQHHRAAKRSGMAWRCQWLALLLAGAAAPATWAQSAGSLTAARAALERDAGGPVLIDVAPGSGRATFIAARGRGIASGAPAGGDALARTRAFLAMRGKALGLPGAAEVELAAPPVRDGLGMEHLRLQQVYRGVPVAAGQVTVHLRGDAITAVHARSVAVPPGMALVPAIDADAAQAAARATVRQAYGAADAELSAPQLQIFDRALFDGTRAAVRLAWYIEARAELLRARLWIDAASGADLLHFNEVAEARDRRVHDPDPVFSTQPGVLRRSEGQPPSGDVDVDLVYDYGGATYDYYLAEHGRDSWDGAGAPMVAVANYTFSFSSFWTGANIVIADVIVTDDIVAHEWTHGVTQTTSGLIYFAESGAMNESYSDIFGEVVDLTNGLDEDAPAHRWALFERFLGANGYRNMRDPHIGVTAGPSRMGDAAYFHCDPSDAVGVHTNSAIGNHGFALMVDGGTFNGYTAIGIGLEKAAAIQYRALTLYLTPTSTYRDNYLALQQACADLTGTLGISAADCSDMVRALDAVEMWHSWPCACGNNTLDAGEECDDGDLIDGDGCDSNCTTTGCGNGIVTGAEACDGGDCCLPSCQLAAVDSTCADDGNDCTAHRCSAIGVCERSEPNSVCNDGDPGTIGDQCSAGVCSGVLPGIDRFKCYVARDLKQPQFVAQSLSLADSFESVTGTAKRPRLLCSPVTLNSTPPVNPAAHLACYKWKQADPPAAPARVRAGDVFGSVDLQLGKPVLFCAPSVATELP